MTFVLSIQHGAWRFYNGHLLHRGTATSVNGKNSWVAWRCVFCKRCDYQL